MVRRMLVRATTKSYSQIFAELVTLLRRSERANAGDAIEATSGADQVKVVIGRMTSNSRPN